MTNHYRLSRVSAVLLALLLGCGLSLSACKRETGSDSDKGKAADSASGTQPPSSLTGRPQVESVNWNPPPADVSPPPEQVATLEKGMADIEAAFRSGKLAQAVEVIHPCVRAEYKAMFDNHPERLERVAKVLATRKLVALAGDVAEFDITDNGRTYPITMELAGGKWLLTGL